MSFGKDLPNNLHWLDPVIRRGDKIPTEIPTRLSDNLAAVALSPRRMTGSNYQSDLKNLTK
jgi:hypothetical protein